MENFNRENGKILIDFIFDYMKNVEKYHVTPDVEPGFLKPLLPESAPEHAEDFKIILEDFKKCILPGIVHWQHPRFHAYFPSANAFPSILADMLSDALGVISFSWASSPSGTELEFIMMDWVAKALGLPKDFLSTTKGGGCIQNTASDGILAAMLAARHKTLLRLGEHDSENSIEDECEPDAHFVVRNVSFLPKLVAYCSAEAHSCVGKAALIALVKIRKVETDSTGSIDIKKFQTAILEDLKNGLIPFFVGVIFGSTSSCFIDNLPKIAEVIEELGPEVWIHVDAAYAGGALICPELRNLMPGLEKANSININPNKWLLTVADCSLLWVKDRVEFTQAFVVNPLYLQHNWSTDVIDLRHWGIPLSRRFRSLKLWFVMRMYGLENIRNHIRNHIELAKKFSEFVKEDKRFEVTNEPVRLGLVCFRLVGDGTKEDSEKLTRSLLSACNDSGEIHILPAICRGAYSIRFCVCAQNSTLKDMEVAWSIFTNYSMKILSGKLNLGPHNPRRSSLRFSMTKEAPTSQCAAMRAQLYDGVSPILVPESSTPQSPKEQNNN